ncbi:MAG TPA: hypothetical protein VIE65_21315 [Methylobacter sp.]|jgi:major vault protein
MMGEIEERGRRERDMVLSPNEFMYVQDETKGEINVFVGPTKQSLSGTDQPVVFDEANKRFRTAKQEEAKQSARTAPEGWYIVLKNPAREGRHPASSGGKVSSIDLDIGRKVNIPGPVSFCLWPGQMAKILKGHILRSNQYLLVRVYDEDAARANWSKAVITPTEEKDQAKKLLDPTKLTMGQTLVIRGTDVSFYIPPTGVEVVPDENNELVREAATLETLDYCLLMDEDGNKRYERGPAVVFPKPTEIFFERKVDDKTTTRKFRAIEIDENSGIYVKVISDYSEGEEGNIVTHKVGEELFITGHNQMIYYPREEHAIVRDDDGSEIYRGVAIPAGEARYVLNKVTGDVSLVRGPKFFLPDPRKEQLVHRILDAKTCGLLFPNNQAALAHNAALAGIDLAQYLDEFAAPIAVAGVAQYAVQANHFMADSDLDLIGSAGITRRLADTAEGRGLGRRAAAGFAGDAIRRRAKNQGPKAVTLSSKFEGAVSVDIWTGYAMLLVRKSGERTVVQGPQTVILQYDELPQVLSLSTGKPKNTDKLFKTAFLLTSANKVADIVEVETRDFCKLLVKVSYRVNFEGEPEQWFNVENYVKFLCDNMRSKVRNAGKKFGIEDFYGNYTEILRDIVLGESNEDHSRPGTSFEENGMRIYDVEVLQVEIQDKDVAKLLTDAQRETLKSTLTLAAESRKLDSLIKTEDIKRKTSDELASTREKETKIALDDSARKQKRDMAVIQAEAQTSIERLIRGLEQEAKQLDVDQARLTREKLASDQSHAFIIQDQELELTKARAETQNAIDKMKAIQPELVSALDAFGERAVIEKVAEAVGPLSILGGKSLADVLTMVLRGTGLEKAAALVENTKNGASAPAIRS